MTRPTRIPKSMKTTKIKATATKKTTTKITLEIDGKKIVVSEQDARQVFNELNEIFGTPNPVEDAVKHWQRKFERIPHEPKNPFPKWDLGPLTCKA